MKKSILTFAVLICFVFTTTAQKKQQKHQKPEFTIEQQTTLAVKKLTLALDLSESQQGKMQPLLKDMISSKQEMMNSRKANEGKRPELSSDEIYAKMIQKLDQQIAFQTKVKKVLSKEQYAKWHEAQAKKHESEKKKMPQQKGGKGKGQKRNS